MVLNLVAYFALALANLFAASPANQVTGWLVFVPGSFLHGAVWQPLTYSLIHTGIIGTLFELLSLWFPGRILEPYHGDAWVTGLYIASDPRHGSRRARTLRRRDCNRASHGSGFRSMAASAPSSECWLPLATSTATSSSSCSSSSASRLAISPSSTASFVLPCSSASSA